MIPSRRRVGALVLALGAIVLAGGFDYPVAREPNVLVQWDVATGEEVSRAELPDGWAVTEYRSVDPRLAVVQMRRCIASAGTERAGVRVVGLDPRTGRTRWTADDTSLAGTGFNEISGPPVTASRVVLVTPGPLPEVADELHGIDVRTGETRWEREWVPGLTVVGGRTAVTTRTDTVRASDLAFESTLAVFDVVTGHRRWTDVRTGLVAPTTDGRLLALGVDNGPEAGQHVEIRTRDGRRVTEFPIDQELPGTRFAMSTDTLLVSAAQSTVAYDLPSGTERWRVPTGVAVFDDGTAFVTKDRPQLDGRATPWRAYDVTTGVERWTLDAGDVRIFGSDGDVLVMGDYGDEIIGIDAATGAVQWQRPYPQLTNGEYVGQEIQPSVTATVAHGRLTLTSGCATRAD